MNWKTRLKKTFGSLTRVADLLEITPQAINDWNKVNKVPEKHHNKLIAEAEKLGYKLTVKQLRRYK